MLHDRRCEPGMHKSSSCHFKFGCFVYSFLFFVASAELDGAVHNARSHRRDHIRVRVCFTWHISKV